MSGVERIRFNRLLGPAVAEEIAARTADGPIGDVTCCECKSTENVCGMFRCFFCLSWFCQNCAEKHFGKSREQYWKDKRTAALRPNPSTKQEVRK